MGDKKIPIFIDSFPRLPLLNEHGRAFIGLENSSSPELVVRVKSLLEYLNEWLGFTDSQEGRENQKYFNVLMRSIYPEMMIDLADLVYAQHERVAVILSFDQINRNLEEDLCGSHDSLEMINKKMGQMFYQLAKTIIEIPTLKQDPKIINLLSESYSFYLYQTKNFPWEYSVPSRRFNSHKPILDVATGLAGFSMIYNWPDNFPKLVLSDNNPFIGSSLSHYLKLTSKKNVIFLEADFPRSYPEITALSSITANKFLHHLNRSERIQFLKWSMDVLQPKGVLEILETDLEHHILEQSKNPGFRDKLTVGYRETLVEIEKDFLSALKSDVENAGFQITHIDCQDYFEETDAFSQKVGDNLELKFAGLELVAEKPN